MLFYPGNVEFDQARQDLENLSRARLPRDQIVTELQRIYIVMNENQPKPEVPPIDIRKKQDFLWALKEDHPVFVRKIYHFILTGNVRCHLSTSLIVQLNDIEFLDKQLCMDGGKVGLEIVDMLENIKDQLWCQIQPFMVVYAKCVFSENKLVSNKAIQKFYDICDIPRKLFLFMEISEKMISKVGADQRQSKSRTLAGGDTNLQKPSNLDDLRLIRLAKFNSAGGATASSSADIAELSHQISADAMDAQIISKKRNKEKFSTLKLDNQKLKSCFVNFLERINPELLLFFLEQDKDYLKSEESDYLDFRYLFEHFKPVLKEDDYELKNLVITYYLCGFKEFRHEAEEYEATHRILNGIANIVFSCIMDFAGKVENGDDTDFFMEKWKKFNSDQRFKEENLKYFEQTDQYSIKEDHCLYLTLQHLPENLLSDAKVYFIYIFIRNFLYKFSA